MHLKTGIFSRARHMLLLSYLNKLLCVSSQEVTEFTQPVIKCEIKCCSSNCFHRARITGTECIMMRVSVNMSDFKRGVEKIWALISVPNIVQIFNPITFCSKMINS